jgi:general secretion pathway protein F
MRATGVFPPILVHLVRVGEESGRQDEMMLRAADILDTEAHRAVDRLLALLTPTLTILMGLIVAAVIGSILTAVLSVYEIAI